MIYWPYICTRTVQVQPTKSKDSQCNLASSDETDASSNPIPRFQILLKSEPQLGTIHDLNSEVWTLTYSVVAGRRWAVWHGVGCVSPMHVYRARQASPTHFLVCVRPIQPWLGHTAAQSVRALSSKTKTDLTRDRSGQLTTATQSRQATASSQRVRSWIPLPVVSCAIIWSRRWRVLSSLARVGQSAIEQTLALVVVDGMDSCRVVVRSTSIGLWNFANCRTSMQIGNHWASYVENWDRSLHATDPAESPLAGSLQTDMSVSLTRPIDRLVCVDTGFHPHGF
jgi:hypothetical protein